MAEIIGVGIGVGLRIEVDIVLDVVLDAVRDFASGMRTDSFGSWGYSNWQIAAEDILFEADTTVSVARVAAADMTVSVV